LNGKTGIDSSDSDLLLKGRKHLTIVAILLSASMALGMGNYESTQTSKRDPALEKLDCFVGDWKSDAKVFPGKFGPGGQASGTTHYHWAVGNNWLIFDSAFSLPGMVTYEVHGLVAYDQKEGKYVAYAVNNLAPHAIEYRGEWKDENSLIFTSVTKSSVGKWSRVVYEKLPDGKIRFSSEESSDGAAFTRYFESTLSR